MVKDGEAAAVGFADIDDEVEIRVFRSLDFFGDITTVQGRSHTASVRARTDCTVSVHLMQNGSVILQQIFRENED